jgi:hypothetical protein
MNQSLPESLRFHRVVYLDPLLISLIYEEVKGVAPVTRITKTEDVGGAIGAGIFKVSASAKETREFSVSTMGMFADLEPRLREFPLKRGSDSVEQVRHFWTRGFLGVGKFEKQSEGKAAEGGSFWFFQIADKQPDPTSFIFLVTQDSYFAPGFDQLAANKDKVHWAIWEPVEALLLPVSTNHYVNVHFFTPFVILKVRDSAVQGELV